MLDALRALGVGPLDLRTSGLSVLPRFDSNRTTQVVGYTATNYVTVTVTEVDRAGELLDAALRAGANRVSGVHFDIRDAAALRQQALTEAGRTARARADAIAAGLGLAYAATSALADEGLSFAVPAGSLIVLVLVATLAGVLAAILPARRAARLDPLTALAYE